MAKVSEGRQTASAPLLPSGKRPEGIIFYCLTKISIRSKPLIFCVFSLFIVRSPFLYIARTKAVLTGLKAYQPRFMARVTVFRNGEETEVLVRQ